MNLPENSHLTLSVLHTRYVQNIVQFVHFTGYSISYYFMYVHCIVSIIEGIVGSSFSVPWFAVYIASHLCSVVDLHPVGILRTDSYHREVWEGKSDWRGTFFNLTIEIYFDRLS